MRTLFQTIRQQFLEGNDLVLVSIIASSGSTPRGAGSPYADRTRRQSCRNYRRRFGGIPVPDLWHWIFSKKESCEHEYKLNQ